MFVHPSGRKPNHTVTSEIVLGIDRPASLPLPTPAPPSTDTFFWLWYSASMFLATLTLILNAMLGICIFCERHKTFRSSFYTIIVVFVVTMVVNSLSQLFDLIGVVLLGLNSPGASSASMLADLTISYFSTVLIKTLRLILVGSFVGSVVISFVIFYASGCERIFEGDKMVDYVEHIAYIQVSNYVFYAIPLISSVFYLGVFNSLRLKRADAISRQTKAMLDRAEKCNLKQGIMILITYLICLLMHVALQISPPDGFSHMLLSALQEITATAPQLAIPISVLGCSRDARAATRRCYCTSLKQNISSTFGFSKITRTGSASSRILPIITKESKT
ncbi:unnamed protein product [Cylicocyclus nassatus]|uniref:G protein-coupled receptor n=1 Tax=Cylicocyclus nassatus TaxID=53992 RepID=A0AA36H2G0_CYLNA|nr:unnamed protein product [Cylicocyclus nassatus]